MEKEISNELGVEVDYKKESKAVKLEVKYDGKGLDSGLYVEVSAEYLLDKLAEKIPGEWDDAVLKMLKAAL